MGVYGSVSCSACKVLSLPIWDMITVLHYIPLSKSKVDEEDLMRGLVESNAEVIWFDIPVDIFSAVDVLDP